MGNTFLTIVAVLAMSFAASSVTVAQDKPDMKAKKEEMKDMAKDKAKEMDKSDLKTVACDPMCGFRVTSHDEGELVGIVKGHAKAHHKKDVTDADVKGMMKPAMKMGDYEKKEKKDEKKPHKY